MAKEHIMKLSVFVSFLILFTFMLSGCASGESSSETSRDTFSEIVSENESESSAVSRSDPEPHKITVSFDSEDKTKGYVKGKGSKTLMSGEAIEDEITAKPWTGYKFVSWSDGSTSPTRGKGEVFSDSASLTAQFEYDTLEMPVIAIDTEGGKGITSKTTYISASCTLTNADESLCFTEKPMQIRGRGNYSWTGTEKKSYRIKFDKKIGLLGQGNAEAKSWTLLAVHCDKSLLRTDAAFFFASKLGTLPFVSSSTFAELYLNGKYEGVYEVCDQIQVHSGRVDIDDSGEGTDIGYLVELDVQASENRIKIYNGNTFEVKSAGVNKDQLEYITSYLGSCLEAIESGDKQKAEKLIDIPSAVDSYLVEELMKNLDVGWGSFYFTKPKGGKLCFGPVWDFDLCAGNANDDRSTREFRSYEYTYVGNEHFDYSQQNDWFAALRRCEWFNELVSQRWTEVKQYAEETVKHISETAGKYQNSFKRNFERWKIFSKRINREPNDVLRIKSFTGQTEFLEKWLTSRIEWLTKYFAGEAEDI